MIVSLATIEYNKSRWPIPSLNLVLTSLVKHVKEISQASAVRETIYSTHSVAYTTAGEIHATHHFRPKKRARMSTRSTQIAQSVSRVGRCAILRGETCVLIENGRFPGDVLKGSLIPFRSEGYFRSRHFWEGQDERMNLLCDV